MAELDGAALTAGIISASVVIDAGVCTGAAACVTAGADDVACAHADREAQHKNI